MERERARVALEVQSPFSTMILQGSKEIETRDYTLEEDFIGQPVYLLQSSPPTLEGRAATLSSLPDIISEADAETLGLLLIGTVVFSSCFEYTDDEKWESEREKHCVPLHSPFDWTAASGRRKWGWVVDNSKSVPFASDCLQRVPSLARKYRSLFEVCK